MPDISVITEAGAVGIAVLTLILFVGLARIFMDIFRKNNEQTYNLISNHISHLNGELDKHTEFLSQVANSCAQHTELLRDIARAVKAERTRNNGQP